MQVALLSRSGTAARSGARRGSNRRKNDVRLPPRTPATSLGRTRCRRCCHARCGAAVVTGACDPLLTQGMPSLRRDILRERSVASRLRSLRSPLRGLDPAYALPEEWQLSVRQPVWSPRSRSLPERERRPASSIDIRADRVTVLSGFAKRRRLGHRPLDRRRRRR